VHVFGFQELKFKTESAFLFHLSIESTPSKLKHEDMHETVVFTVFFEYHSQCTKKRTCSDGPKAIQEYKDINIDEYM